MKNNLFRKEAVESAQRTFDTRENLSALPLNTKLVAFLLVLCFALFAVWMFFGNLTQTLKADGIIYSKILTPTYSFLLALLLFFGFSGRLVNFSFY